MRILEHMAPVHGSEVFQGTLGVELTFPDIRVYAISLSTGVVLESEILNWGEYHWPPVQKLQSVSL